MEKQKAIEKIDLAQIYFEDGAPETALKILLEQKKILGPEFVDPLIKICKKEIGRRKILKALAWK